MGSDGNKITGTPPESFRSMNFSRFHFESNQLSGKFQLERLPRSVRSVKLGYNQLTGILPEEMLELTDMLGRVH
jgi:hypothetical protein